MSELYEGKTAKQWHDDYLLEFNGRQQDGREYKELLRVVWEIAESEYKPWYNDAGFLQKRAQHVLTQLGLAVEVAPGVKASKEWAAKNAPKN